MEIEYYKSSIDELPFPDASFDAIFSAFILQYHVPLNVKKRAFHEMKRILRKGGRIIIADFGPPAHVWGWFVYWLIFLKFLFRSPSRDSLFHPLPALMTEAGITILKEHVLKQYIHIIKAS